MRSIFKSAVVIAVMCVVWGCTHTMEVATVAIGGEKQAKLLLTTESGGQIYALAFSPSGDAMAIADSADKVRIWDLKTGKLTRVLGGHGRAVLAAAYSPDGKRLATAGSSDGAVRIYDAESGTQIQRFDKVSPEIRAGCLSFGSREFFAITALAFDPEGKRIITGDASGSVKIIDAFTGTLIEDLRWHGNANVVQSISPDSSGKLLAISGGETHYRQVQNTGYRQECASYKNGKCTSYRSVQYTYYTTVVYYTPLAKVIELLSKKELISINRPSGGMVKSAALSPDGTLFAIGGIAGNIEIYDLRSGKTHAGFKGVCGAANVSFSRDGKYLSAGCGGKSLTLWNAKTGELFTTLQGIPGAENRTVFYPVGNICAVYGNYIVRLWDFSTGRQLALLALYKKKDWVAASPDGRYDGMGEGMKKLEWQIGDQKVPLQSFGADFAADGLLAQVLSKKLTENSGVDVMTQLVGKVFSVNERIGEVVVASGRSREGVKMGDKLFVMAQGKKLILDAYFPMQTVVKCRVGTPDSGSLGAIRKGMPVFK